MVILLDTSALIEFSKGTGSPVHLRVVELIEAGALIGVTEPVVMEYVAGLRAGDEDGFAVVDSFELFTFDTTTDFDEAAHIYRLCRAAGITPRDMVDCMIASVATRHDAAILSADIDFARIASVIDLKLDPATPRE